MEGGYVIDQDGWQVTPFLSVQYTRLEIDNYTETEAGALNLIVDDQDYDALKSGVGFTVAYPIVDASGEWVPEFRFVWLYDHIADEQQVNSTFVGGGPSFATAGFKPEASSFNLGGSLTLYAKNDTEFAVYYDAELKDDYIGHFGVASLTWNY